MTQLVSVPDGLTALVLLSIPVVALLALASLAVGVVMLVRRARPTAPDPALAADDVHSHARLTALLFGLIIPFCLVLTVVGWALITSALDAAIVGTVCLVAAIGAAAVALAVAEATWSGRSTPRRTASLRPRSIARLTGRIDRPAAWAGLGLALVALAVLLTQSQDRQAGRWGVLGGYVDARGRDVDPPVALMPEVSPWHVWAIVGLAALAVGLAVGLTEFSLHRIATRPGLAAITPELDEETRRFSARRVTRALTAFAAVSLGLLTLLVGLVPGPEGYAGALDEVSATWAYPFHTATWWLLVIAGGSGSVALAALTVRPTRPPIDWSAGL